MATIKITIFMLAAIFLFTLSVKQVDSQKCKTKWNDSFEFTKNFVDYRIVYNISDTKTEQTCFDLIENFVGKVQGEDIATFIYKIGGVIVKRDGEFIWESDKQLYLVFKDSPNDKIAVFADQPTKGIGIVYACSGSQEYILIGYESTKPELAAVADDLAKGLTDKNVADFKITRDNC